MKNNTKKIISVVIVAIVVIGVISYVALSAGPGEVAPGKEFIYLGGSLPLSGPSSAMGKEVELGYRYAIDDINKDGGIYVEELGRKLPVIYKYYDDESKPEKSKLNAEKAITLDNVDFVLASWSTPLNIPMGAVVEKYDQLMVGCGSSVLVWEESGYDSCFIMCLTNIWVGESFFKLLLEKMDEMTGEQPFDPPETIVLWEDETETTKGMVKWILEYSEDYPQYKIYVESFAINQPDYSTLINKTKEINPDILWVNPLPADAITLLQQCKELGFWPKLIVFARGHEYIIELGAETVEGIMATAGEPFILPGDPVHESIKERLLRDTGVEIKPMTLPAYAAVQVLAEGIRRAGTLDRARVRDTIATLEMKTVLGTVIFNGTTHPDMPECYQNVQWQNGELVVLSPPEVAEAEMEYPIPGWIPQ